MDPHMDPEAWRFAFNLVRLFGGLVLTLASCAAAYGLWRLYRRPPPSVEGLALLDEPRPLAKAQPREMVDA